MTPKGVVGKLAMSTGVPGRDAGTVNGVPATTRKCWEDAWGWWRLSRASWIAAETPEGYELEWIEGGGEGYSGAGLI